MRRLIRALVISDSALVRQTLNEILSSDIEITVMGVAFDPYLAARQIAEENQGLLRLRPKCRAWTASPFCAN
jgi:two-component system, chemotaxis family, protein-glutamate methylesterase/glutaminase